MIIWYAQPYCHNGGNIDYTAHHIDPPSGHQRKGTNEKESDIKQRGRAQCYSKYDGMFDHLINHRSELKEIVLVE